MSVSPRKKAFYLTAIIIVLLMYLAYFSYHQSLKFVRDPKGLMTKYAKLKKKDAKKAQSVLALILKVEPNNQWALKNTIEYYIEQKDYPRAFAFINRLNALLNDNEINYLQKGFVYQASGKTLNACHSYQKAALLSEDENIKKWANSASLYCYHQSLLDNHPIENQDDLEIYLLDSFYFNQAADNKISEAILNLGLTLLPKSHKINLEKGKFYQQHNQPLMAKWAFEKSYFLKKDKESGLKLAYIYLDNHQFKSSLDVFNEIKNRLNPESSENFEQSYLLAYENSIEESIAQSNKKLYKSIVKSIHLSEQQIKKNKAAILQNKAYQALNDNDYEKALAFQKKAYALNESEFLAMQIGYTLQKMHDGKESIRYFNLAKKSQDKAIKKQAQNALDNLSGISHSLLPNPYFSEIYFAPFYFSRFDLAVMPSIFRLGKWLEDDKGTQVYLSVRYTKDNKSQNKNQISQIFEDNVFVSAIGASTRFFNDYPIRIFIEAGMATDLIYQNRDKSRWDVRGGGFYANNWHHQKNKNAFINQILGDETSLYADAIYFSRYDNNIISTINFRHHNYLMQNKKVGLVDRYLLGRASFDTNQDFFNNFIEYGIGVSFKPANLSWLTFSVEQRFGNYLTFNSKGDNPYNNHYQNRVAQIVAHVML